MYPLGSEAIDYVLPNILLILNLIELVRMHIIQSSVSQHTHYLIMQMIIIDRWRGDRRACLYPASASIIGTAFDKVPPDLAYPLE